MIEYLSSYTSAFHGDQGLFFLDAALGEFFFPRREQRSVPPRAGESAVFGPTQQNTRYQD